MSYILIGPVASLETANKLHELAPWLNSCHTCIKSREARVHSCRAQSSHRMKASHCALVHQLLSLKANIYMYVCIHTQIHIMYTQTHIYTHVHKYTYIYAHTYICKIAPNWMNMALLYTEVGACMALFPSYFVFASWFSSPLSTKRPLPYLYPNS